MPEIVDCERLLELVVGGCPSVFVREVGLKYEALRLCNPWQGAGTVPNNSNVCTTIAYPIRRDEFNVVS